VPTINVVRVDTENNKARFYNLTFSRPYLASGRWCRNGAVSANLVQYRSRCTARAVLLISLSSRHGSSA
jgi:hypothetical protein